MKKIKVLALVIALAMIMAVFIGCTGAGTTKDGEAGKQDGISGQNGKGATDEPAVEIKMLFPGAPPKDEAMVLGEMNKKSLAEINTTYSIEWVPWGDWDMVHNTKLQSGEPLDGVLIFDPLLAQMWVSGAFTPLNEWISPEKTPGLLSVIPLEVFEDMSIGGNYTCFPSIVSFQNWYIAANIRKDLREKYGMKPITTLEELEEYLTKVAENEPDMVPASAIGTLQHIYGRVIGYVFFAGPGYLDGGIAMVDPDTHKVSNYLESEHFKFTIQTSRRWYEKGIFTPDSNTPNAPTLESGRTGFATHDITMADSWNYSNTLEGVEFERVIINPDAIGFRDFWGNNLVCIPHSSRHPERVVRWVDWLYGDWDNYILLLYGIKGVHWEYMEGDTERVQVPAGKDPNDYPMWHMWQWAQGALDPFRPTMKDDTIALLKKFRSMDTPVVKSPTLGFYADLKPVEEEWALIREAWEKYGQPLVEGRVPIEGNYEKLLEEMKKAGADKFIAEMQRQYDDWRASKGK
ncbi:MAG: extracellular solute-binding protein [Clostridiaceae bacterium]|nr:extracellular solute-binding protein [Clostridiaceae bacterium]